MKNRTALEGSRVGALAGGVLTVVLGVLSVVVAPCLAIPAAFIGLFVAGDVFNMWYIKRKGAKDPTYLDKKIDT